MIRLKPDKSLLDPHFDGYKLDLNSIPMYNTSIPDLDEAELTPTQYSYQHIKALGVFNHIFCNPFEKDIVYFIDKDWNVNRIISHEHSVSAPVKEWQIPDHQNKRMKAERVNATMSFPCADHVFIADGTGSLYLIEITDVCGEKKWNLVYVNDVLENCTNFQIVHSIRTSTSQHITKECYQCVLLNVEENDSDDQPKKDFCTMINWLTIKSNEQHEWQITQRRKLKSYSYPDYVSVDTQGEAIYVASEEPFQFLYDSLNPVNDLMEDSSINHSEDLKKYTWSQNEQEVMVKIPLPVSTNKDDIQYNLTNNHLSVSIIGGEVLAEGTLSGPVQTDESSWTLSGSELEIYLTRAHKENWSHLIVGDTSGELVYSDEQSASIHERLAAFTSDKLNPNPDKDTKAFNSQELEECDQYPYEEASLMRFDGCTHLITQKVNLSNHQWLFNCIPENSLMPAICLRHDIDGVIWQPLTDCDNGQFFKHSGTFNAFGYVQASKQQKKYISCAPNMSYLALADNVRHIYIYEQPSTILSPLRNRKSGAIIGTVSKQRVISLESTDPITGLFSDNYKLYVIAGKKLHVYIMKTNDCI